MGLFYNQHPVEIHYDEARYNKQIQPIRGENFTLSHNMKQVKFHSIYEVSVNMKVG